MTWEGGEPPWLAPLSRSRPLDGISGSPMLNLPERPLILGHRGAPFEAPENTFGSFRLAMAHGADGVEPMPEGGDDPDVPAAASQGPE